MDWLTEVVFQLIVRHLLQLSDYYRATKPAMTDNKHGLPFVFQTMMLAMV